MVWFNLRRWHLITPLVIVGALSSQACFATIGTTDYGYGSISKGMGGTVAALPQDPLVVAVNPAGISLIDDQFEFGLTVFSPHRGYTASSTGGAFFGVAPGTHWSSKNYFPIPNLSYSSHICNTALTWAIALYGNGGINATYENNITGATFGFSSGVFSGGTAGPDFKQFFLNIALAWQVNPVLSVGLSLIPVMQTFNMRGISAFGPLSVNPQKLSNTGTDLTYGVGARAGILYKPVNYLAFGFGYQPRISMTKTSDYRGLLAHGGNIDIPANGTIGVTFNPNTNIAISGDIQKIFYRSIPPYGNRNDCVPGSGTACLGSTAGFGWSNATAYKVGLQWIANQLWTLRAGYAFAERIIPQSQMIFNILSPAVTQSHYTLGFTRSFNHCLDLNVNAMYAPKVTISGKNQFNPGQTISLFMYQYELGASLIWKL